jgi:hypothetical protein
MSTTPGYFQRCLNAKRLIGESWSARAARVKRDGAETMGDAAGGAATITHVAVASPPVLAADRLRRENERLRMERDSQKSRAHLRSGLPIKFGFVDEHRHIRPVRVMCTALGLSDSGYCAWRSRVGVRVPPPIEY